MRKVGSNGMGVRARAVSEGRRLAPEQRATAVRAEARHSFAHVRSGALAGMGAGGGSTRGRGEMAATAAASAARCGRCRCAN